NGIYSNVRISVNVAAPAPVPAPQVLPQTGASWSDLPMAIWQKVIDGFNQLKYSLSCFSGSMV
ncbi:MAG: hypothetical protein NT135_01455, partial [Candidatus Berkelbacteria bacterium]|nr:hypothetical protein [Candidatus Berkelbacteria bacterium]